MQLLEHRSFDLLILDMVMDPGMSGLETYRAILEKHPGQRAIVASGFAEDTQIEETLKLGAGAAIRKPYAIEVIGVAVRTELDRPVDR